MTYRESFDQLGQPLPSDADLRRELARARAHAVALGVAYALTVAMAALMAFWPGQ